MYPGWPQAAQRFVHECCQFNSSDLGTLEGHVITPRDYQLEAVACARAAFRTGEKTALIHLPTGAGKSLTAAEFIRQLLEPLPKYRTLIIVPRASIIDSFASAIKAQTGITPTIAAASSHGVDLTGQIVIGMHQTLSRRTLPHFDLCLGDEIHRLDQRAPDSSYMSVVRRCMDQGARLLAFTATPFRQDGYIYGPGKLFEAPVFSRTLKWTTENGYTVRAVLKAPTDEATSFNPAYLEIDSSGDYTPSSVALVTRDPTKVRAQVEDMLVRAADRKKIAVACANIEHCEAVAEMLRLKGQKVSVVTSELDVNARSISLGDFQTDTETRFMCFVSILAEGYDQASIDCVTFLRPTRSSVFYLQCVGRALRPYPGKESAMILDYGNVVKNCGPLDNPIVNRETGKNANLKEMTALAFDIVQCNDCGAFMFPDKNAVSISCPECGSSQPKPERVVDKNLERQAEKDAKLYEDDVEDSSYEHGEYEILSFRIESRGSQEQRRMKKYVYVALADGRDLTFIVNNPHFAPTAQMKFFYRKLESQIEKLLTDCMAGEKVDLRSIEMSLLKARARVLVTVDRRVPNVLHMQRPFDRYISHRIMKADEDAVAKGARGSAGLSGVVKQEGLVLLSDSDKGSV